MISDKELLLKVDRARWKLSQVAPFYFQLACKLRDELGDVPTCCTDGARIVWGREYLDALSPEETLAELMHETGHCAHLHLWRVPMDARGNWAADQEIDQVVEAMPGANIPKTAVDIKPSSRGLAVEEIYARAPKDLKPPPRLRGGGGQFSSPAPDSTPAQGQDTQPSSIGNLREKWVIAIQQAELVAKATKAGALPSDLTAILASAKHQVIDWRRELIDFARTVLSTRADWSHSARRHAWQTIVYPSRKRDAIATIVCVRDTSGSMSDTQGALISDGITAALADTGATGIVLDVDTQVQAEYRLAVGEPCPMTWQGRGGTDLQPAFARVTELQEAGEQIAGVVYFTDGEGPEPASVEVPTLWVVYGGKKVMRTGRTVHMAWA